VTSGVATGNGIEWAEDLPLSALHDLLCRLLTNRHGHWTNYWGPVNGLGTVSASG